MALEFKEHPKLLKLPYLASFAAARQCETEMDAHVSVVDGAGLPFSPAAHTTTLKALLKRFEDCILDVVRYRTGILRLKMENVTKILEGKRSWRGGRDGYQKALKKSNIWAGVSKLFADHLMASESPPSKANLSFSFTERTSSKEDELTLDYFREPRLFPAACETWFGRSCSEYIAKNTDRAAAATKKIHTSMNDYKKLSGLMDFTSDTAFSWNPTDQGAKAIFEEVCTSKPVLWTTEELKVESSKASAWPFRGVRLVLHGLEGQHVIAIIPASDMLEHSNLQDWLKACKPEDISHLEVFIVPQGASLFVPFGSTPLIMGWSKTELKAMREEAKDKRGPKAAGAAGTKSVPKRTSLAVNFCCSKVAETAVSSAVCHAVLAQWVANANKIPKDIATAEDIVQWRTYLGTRASEDREEASVAAAV